MFTRLTPEIAARLRQDQKQRIRDVGGDLTQLSPDELTEIQEAGEEIGDFSAGLMAAESGLRTAIAGAAQGFGLESLAQTELQKANQVEEELGLRYQRDVPSIIKEFEEEGVIGGIAALPEYLKETLAFSLPPTGTALAAGATGTLLAGPGVGLGLAVAAGTPIFAGNNLKRQMEENDIGLEDTNIIRAFSVGGLQAGFDATIGRVLGFMGPRIPNLNTAAGQAWYASNKQLGDKLIAKNIEKVGKAAQQGYTNRFLRKGAKGAAVEAVTEASQQYAEIVQADPSRLLDLTEEQRFELYESAIAGGLLGGTITGTTGAVFKPSLKDLEKLKNTDLDRHENDEVLEGQEMQRAGEFLTGTPDTAEQRPDVLSPTAQPVTEEDPVITGLPIPEPEIEGVKRILLAGGAVQPQTLGAMFPNSVEIDQSQLPESLQRGNQLSVDLTTSALTDAQVEQSINELQPRAEPAKVDTKGLGKKQPKLSRKGYEVYRRKDDSFGYNVYTITDGENSIEFVRTPESQVGNYTSTVLNPSPKVAKNPLIGGVTREPTTDNLSQTVDQIVEEWDSADFAPAKKRQPKASEKKKAMADLRKRLGELGLNEKQTQVFLESQPETLKLAQRYSRRRAENQSRLVRETVKTFASPEKRLEFEGKSNRVRQILADRLKAVGLGDVALEFEGVIQDPKAGDLDTTVIEGVAKTNQAGAVTIALSNALYDPDISVDELTKKLGEVMNHEMIHAIKSLGLISEAEYNTLVKAAKQQKYVDRSGKTRLFSYFDRAQRLYPLDEGQDAETGRSIQEEEAVAELFRDWAAGRKKITGKPRSLFKRIADFIRNLGKDIKEDPSAASIFRAIDSGAIGGRERISPIREINAEEDANAESVMFSAKRVMPDNRSEVNLPTREETLSFHNFAPRILDKFLGVGKTESDPDIKEGTRATIRLNLNGRSYLGPLAEQYKAEADAELARIARIPDSEMDVAAKDNARNKVYKDLDAKYADSQTKSFAIQTAHQGNNPSGQVLAYDTAFTVENVEFIVKEDVRAKIQGGLENKSPMAGVSGDVVHGVKKADGVIAKFNPFDKNVHTFYIEIDGAKYPIKGAQSATVFGSKVYVQDPTFFTEEDMPTRTTTVTGKATRGDNKGETVTVDLPNEPAFKFFSKKSVKPLITDVAVNSDDEVVEIPIELFGTAKLDKEPPAAEIETEVDVATLRAEDNPFGVNLDETIIPIYPGTGRFENRKEGSVLKSVAIKELYERYVEATGDTKPLGFKSLGKDLATKNEENIDIVGRKMATELLKAIEPNGDPEQQNAIGWYDEKLTDALEIIKLIDPRVSETEENQQAFIYALAVTSNGQAVFQNFELALDAFNTYMTSQDQEGQLDRKFPENTWEQGGDRRLAMRKAWQFFNVYNNLFGDPDAKGINLPIGEFLNKKFVFKDLKAWVTNFNAEHDASLTVPSSMLAGNEVESSIILGPKIGYGFYQNLQGNYDNLTADIWWMRMWNRMINNPFKPRPTQQKIESRRISLRNEMLNSNNKVVQQITEEALQQDGLTEEDLQSDAVIDSISSTITSRWESYFKRFQNEKNKNPVKPQFFKDAKSHKEGFQDTPVESPRGPGEREYMKLAVNRAQELLKEQGVDITTADFQAALWYPEKRLFRMMGVRPGQGQDVDYVDAAINVAKQKGISNDAIQEALADSSARRDSSRASARRTDGSVRDPVQGVPDTAGETVRQSRKFSTRQQAPQQVSAPVDLDEITERFLGTEEETNPFARFWDKTILGRVDGETRWQAFTRNAVNRFLPGYLLDDYLNGEITDPANSVGQNMELAQNTTGRLQALLDIGPLAFNKDTGTVEQAPDPKLKGLRQIFEPIGTNLKRPFQTYAIARRELKRRQSGLPAGFLGITEQQAQDTVDQLITKYPVFAQVHDDYQAFNEQMIEFAKQSGLLTQEQADSFRNMDYVPFYRLMEETTPQSGFQQTMSAKARAALKDPNVFEKELEGSLEKIGDLYEIVTKNAKFIVSAGLRNHAMDKTGQALEMAELKGGLKSWGRLAKKGDTGNIMTLQREGEEVSYKILDPALWTAVSGLTEIQKQSWIRWLETLGGILRSGVTLMPGFQIANLWRGKVDAYIKTGVPMFRLDQTARAIRDVYSADSDVQRFKLISGMGGYLYGDTAEAIAKTMERDYRIKEGKGPFFQKVGDQFRRGVTALEKTGEASEMAERIVIMRRLMEQGVSEKEAAFQGLNLINFGRKGAGGSPIMSSLVNVLIPTVPFLNARIQGLHRLVEDPNAPGEVKATAFKEMAGRGMLITAGSVTLAGLAMQDEDRWDNETIIEKVTNDIFYVGDTKIRIPKAFEVGALFGTIPVMTIDAIRQESGEDFAQALRHIFLTTFSFNPIPQGVLPILEVAANYDSFRGAPIEGLSLQGKRTEDRSYETTPEIYKFLSKAGLGQFANLSPLELQQLFEGYTGTMGTSMMAMTDTLASETGVIPSKPSGTFGNPYVTGFGQITGLNRFIRQDGEGASRFVREFYQLRRDVEESFAALKDAKERGLIEEVDELVSEKGGSLGFRRQFGRVARSLGKINKEIDLTRLSTTLSPDEKQKRLAELRKEKVKITSQVVRMARSTGYFK